MGVRYLQSVLKQSCSQDAIRKINMRDLSYKTIAVDASIYIYKGVGDNALVENMLVMLSLFRKYNIRAVFVFDGKPPSHKARIIHERQQKKKNAEELYNFAVIMGDDAEAEKLKKQVVRINEMHIRQTKELILACGFEYCEASGEADEVCAMLTLNGTAWACMTEDMDMFLYGCPRILRQMSPYNETVVLNDLPRILSDLEMNSVDEFRRIVVSTGLSDWNEQDIHKDKDGEVADFATLRNALKSHTLYNPAYLSDKICDMNDVVIPPILGNDVKTSTNINTFVSSPDVLYKNGILIV
jgi:hypothetical protein